jgi:hypothetical protein
MRATTEALIVATLPTLPNLDGLIGLAHQDGVDVRPTLLRVLTDLYVDKDAHTADEEHRYTELALRLLAGVDIPTRAAVANKLADHPRAPRPVVHRLARDVFEVAEPVLKHASSLTSHDLLAIIRDLGPRHAAAIAARNVARRVDDPRESNSGRASAFHADEASNPAPSAPTAMSPAKRPSLSLGQYFLLANPSERRLMLADLADQPSIPSEPPCAAASEEAIRELEGAALRYKPEEFARGIERLLRIPAHRTRQIVHDGTGEPTVVIAKALALPCNVLVRILLFLNPRIGHSVERVFSLVDLYDDLTRDAALRLVASWQDAWPADKADYRPFHFDDERSSARRLLATHGRRFPLQVPDDRRSLARRDERLPRGRG